MRKSDEKKSDAPQYSHITSYRILSYLLNHSASLHCVTMTMEVELILYCTVMYLLTLRC